MPVPEGRMLLLDLMDQATRPEFVHAHEWRKGDLDIWDNRSMPHRARTLDPAERRDMHSTTVAGDGQTVEKALVARSEEHTDEVQSLMQTTYAGSCLKQKNDTIK